MRKIIAKIWNDEGGALISVEWVFVATILVLGVTVGLTAVRNAVNSELAEAANAFSALNQSYSFSGQKSSCGCSFTAGSSAINSCDAHQQIHNTHPTTVSYIDDNPCQ
jgi:Flp pilus assembly pilin Flp